MKLLCSLVSLNSQTWGWVTQPTSATSGCFKGQEGSAAHAESIDPESPVFPWSSHFWLLLLQCSGLPRRTVVKNLPAMQEMQKTLVQSLVWEDPLEEEMATNSSILAWKTHGQRSLAGYGSKGHKQLDTSKWLSTHGLRCSLVNSRREGGSQSHGEVISLRTSLYSEKATAWSGDGGEKGVLSASFIFRIPIQSMISKISITLHKVSMCQKFN